MKLTSLATLAAIVFTSSLSATNPFEMREVDMSSVTSTTSKLNLKMKTFKDIKQEFDKSETKSDGVSCEVNITEIDNRSDHKITYGPFEIPAHDTRIFAQGLKKVSPEPGHVSMESYQYPLNAALPIYARDMGGMVSLSFFSGLNDIVVLRNAEGLKKGEKDYAPCIHLTSSYDQEFANYLNPLKRVEKLFLDTDREFAEMDRADAKATAETSTGACSD